MNYNWLIVRVRIIFNLNNRGASVPFHHQHLISEMINKLKQEMDTDYTDYRLYCFSGLKGQTKVGKGGLHFYSNKVTLVLASDAEDFVQSLLRALFKHREVLLGELLLMPEAVEREKRPEFEESVKYICISPLVLSGPYTEDKLEKDFISPFDDTFSDYLYESTMNRMEVTGKYSAEEFTEFYKFQVIPDKAYIEKLQQNAKKFSRIYSTYFLGEKHEIRGYTMPLMLYAHPKVQEFIFTCGFGEYTYNGFGMVDIANVNPLGRTEPYLFDSVALK